MGEGQTWLAITSYYESEAIYIVIPKSDGFYHIFLSHTCDGGAKIIDTAHCPEAEGEIDGHKEKALDV